MPPPEEFTEQQLKYLDARAAEVCSKLLGKVLPQHALTCPTAQLAGKIKWLLIGAIAAIILLGAGEGLGAALAMIAKAGL